MTTPPSAEKKVAALVKEAQKFFDNVAGNDPSQRLLQIIWDMQGAFEELERGYAQLKKSSEFFDKQYYELKAQLKRTELERDRAIAHDTQPYPTAEAYELVCKALDRHKLSLEKAKEQRDSFILRLYRFIGLSDNLFTRSVKVQNVRITSILTGESKGVGCPLTAYEMISKESLWENSKQQGEIIRELKAKLAEHEANGLAVYGRKIEVLKNSLKDSQEDNFKLVEAVELLLRNWPTSRDGMDFQEPIPVGVKACRYALAKIKGG